MIPGRGHLAAVTLGLGLVLLTAAGCFRRAPEPLSLGAPVPAFAVSRLDGGSLRSGEWGRRTVVLNLWATWCVPCREEMPSLEKLSRSLDPAQFLVVGLSQDTDRNLVREFALKYGVTFPLALDPDGKLAKSALGSGVLPDTLIISPQGRLADRVQGGADWTAAAMRERVLAGRGAPTSVKRPGDPGNRRAG